MIDTSPEQKLPFQEDAYRARRIVDAEFVEGLSTSEALERLGKLNADPERFNPERDCAVYKLNTPLGENDLRRLANLEAGDHYFHETAILTTEDGTIALASGTEGQAPVVKADWERNFYSKVRVKTHTHQEMPARESKPHPSFLDYWTDCSGDNCVIHAGGASWYSDEVFQAEGAPLNYLGAKFNFGTLMAMYLVCKQQGIAPAEINDIKYGREIGAIFMEREMQRYTYAEREQMEREFVGFVESVTGIPVDNYYRDFAWGEMDEVLQMINGKRDEA